MFAEKLVNCPVFVVMLQVAKPDNRHQEIEDLRNQVQEVKVLLEKEKKKCKELEKQVAGLIHVC